MYALERIHITNNRKDHQNAVCAICAIGTVNAHDVGKREPGGAGLQQLELTRTHERLGAALHIELAVDVVEMAFDSTDREHQPIGDRLIGMALCNQMQNLDLTV